MPSTVIRSFTYHAAKRLLTIVFQSGMVYAYKDVPEGIYMEMKEAFSKGTFFNKEIKGVYEFEKVDEVAL